MEPQTVSTAERILERWGWPAFFLLLILAAIYLCVRALWPLAKESFAKGLKVLEEGHSLLREQLNVANLRAESQQKEFLAALEEQRKSHSEAMRVQADSHARALAEQTEALREVKESLKRLAEDGRSKAQTPKRRTEDG